MPLRLVASIGILLLLGLLADVVFGFTAPTSIRIRTVCNSSMRCPTLLAASPRLNSVTSVKKKKKKKEVVDDDDEDGVSKTKLPTGLPPALTIDGLTCSHDGGTVYQLKDVSYVLPRQRKIG